MAFDRGARCLGGRRALRDSESRKLDYREQKELDGMETAILQAEDHLVGCQKAVEDPAVASDAWNRLSAQACRSTGRHTPRSGC